MIWQYKVSMQDFKAAQSLHIRSKASRRVAFLIFQRLLPALVIPAIIVFVWGLQQNEVPSWVGGLLGALIWLGIFCPVWRFFAIRSLYKQMKNGRDDSSALELELADNQLISRIPGSSEGRFFPSAVHHFAEDQKVGLIYIAPQRFLLLPRPAFSQSDWDQIKAWLNTPQKAPPHAD